MPHDRVEDMILNYDPEKPQPRLVGANSPLLRKSVSERLPRPVPWPAGLAPTAAPLPRAPSETDDLSKFAGYDAVVVTWTAAEAAALAAMFTPSYLPSKWYEYRHGVDAYVPLVTGGDAPFNDRSKDMARYYRSLGLYFPCTIGSRRVLLFKSGLHLDYDGPQTPVRKLMQELLAVVKPKLFITTGTGGGIGSNVALGDVVVAATTQFFCTTQFKDRPFATSSYSPSAYPPAAAELLTPDLLNVNASLIPNARPTPKIWSGDDATIVTTDFFGFDDSTDHYHLQGKGQVCDMGDAMVGDAVSGSGVTWFAIRNASDPQMPDPAGNIEAAKKAAGEIYKEYGTLTTAGSAIASWAAIAGFFGERAKANEGAARSMATLPGTMRRAVPSARLLGASDPAESIEVSVYLRRNPAGSRDVLTWLASENAKLPVKRRYLSGKEYDRLFGADPGDLESASRWLTSAKLRVVDASVTNRRLVVAGTIGDIEAAFGVHLNEYEHPRLGRFRGREGQLSVPAAMVGVIQAVFGLDTRPVGRPRSRRRNDLPAPWSKFTAKHTGSARARTTSLADLSNEWPGTFFPPQVAGLYDYPAFDGTGQNIAVFAFNSGQHTGGYNAAALQTYFEKVLGGSMPSITNVVVRGVGNSPGPDTQSSSQHGDATGEVMLDVCVVGSLVPKAKVFLYFTEFNTRGWIDALHEAINDKNDISVISISYGNPEDDPDGLWTSAEVDVVNQALESAGARGITVCVASGDDGSGDGEPAGAHVDFPASSPNVWGVGGTKLVAAGSSAKPVIASETVWNETKLGDGAGGGGVSSIFTKPVYQNAVDIPSSANPPHQIGRGVPDAAAVADPVTGVVVMHVDGKNLEPIGGTSASAPLWASLIVRINQSLGARCGFLNELMYTKFATGVLRDITVGNNGAYAARKGWDACTGLGVPGGTSLLKALSGSRSPRSGKASTVKKRNASRASSGRR